MCLTRKLSLGLSFLFFISVNLISFALPTDIKQKLYIIADSIIYNYKTGISIYQGHVQVDQGTTHLTSDKLITKDNAQHKIQQATAYGLTDLAHYWTVTSEKRPPVDAHAHVIIFYPSDSRVILKRQVTVTQGENSFQGELAQYSKKNQTIIVPATSHARAVVIYNPDENKG